MTIQPDDITTPAVAPAATGQAALDQEVRNWVAQGWRIESQMPGQVVLTDGHKINHLLHFFIGLFTLGVWWLLVWLPLGLFGGQRRRVLRVMADGTVDVVKLKR